MENKKNILIGKIHKFIISFYLLIKYEDYNIYLSISLKYHTSKHKNNFISDVSYYYTLKNVNSVLMNPEFVYYDYSKNSIKYFKKLKQYVCVVVKIDKNKAFVATFYPVNKKSILKLKKLLIWEDNMVK